ncbi:rhodanese-like domain-containing protein [Aquimarina latercula]|uniref:rhodanese-like domain-containing protein n=1 Tax=Aquimarina latercula TaxID=987 RepID=UPI0003F9FE42|nr:rhodanese-like domain-containing protein [Aquimarina latercula]
MKDVVRFEIISLKYYVTFLLILGNIFFGFSQDYFRNSSTKEINSIKIVDVNSIKEKVIGKNVQFIDIRTVEEYTNGYIDDAINISIANREKFVSEFQKLNKKKPVYIYCYSGWRSHRAAKLLVKLGFNEVYDFKGGYKAWSSYSEK